MSQITITIRLPNGKTTDFIVAIEERAIVGWVGIEHKGVPLEFTPQNLDLVLNTCPWVRDQLIEHMAHD